MIERVIYAGCGHAHRMIDFPGELMESPVGLRIPQTFQSLKNFGEFFDYAFATIHDLRPILHRDPNDLEQDMFGDFIPPNPARMQLGVDLRGQSISHIVPELPADL